MLVELLSAAIISQPKPIIDLEPQKPKTVKVEKKPEPNKLSVADKVRLNFYKCDTDTHFIREDTAECKSKPAGQENIAQVQSSIAQNNKAVRSNVRASGNTYTPGQCTWHVKNINSNVPNGLGDATNWRSNWPGTVSSTPVVGAVAWKYGHVAQVVAVGNGTVTISEMNYNWVPYSQRTIKRPVSYFTYLY